MSAFRLLLLVLGLLLPLSAQSTAPTSPPSTPTLVSPSLDPLLAGAVAAQDPTGTGGPGVSLQIRTGDGKQTLGSAIEIMLLMTLLAMAPAIVMTMTCFTRIVIVLSFLKRAMSMQDLPPAMITTGFALFMTIFVMRPVVGDIYDQAYLPYVENRMDWREAADIAGQRMNRFMLAQTREEDVALILELSRTPRPATAMATPFHVTVPAFVLSEIKTAFQMGFVLFLPFVVIDLVISSILVSMGMFSLPPVVVSTPLKLLLFILVGGWDLVVTSLAQSFAP
ncbi:MAG: flagellar type III secretion system pore protein FliP [Planctomycetes bacterium]|nr:flagellar type III secretion system pore protein FliP [Planctomycetota bacterium]